MIKKYGKDTLERSTGNKHGKETLKRNMEKKHRKTNSTEETHHVKEPRERNT